MHLENVKRKKLFCHLLYFSYASGAIINMIIIIIRRYYIFKEASQKFSLKYDNKVLKTSMLWIPDPAESRTPEPLGLGSNPDPPK